jgi:microcystin-dependent protein
LRCINRDIDGDCIRFARGRAWLVNGGFAACYHACNLPIFFHSSGSQEASMATPFLAEIKIISFNYAPIGWAFCNGQLLPINQNQALFSLLGTTYGGDGRTNFALPNLQGRAATHVGNDLALGSAGGESMVWLSMSQMPEHSHAVNASSSPATTNDPEANLLATAGGNVYGGAQSLTALSTLSVGWAGFSQGHQNMQPSLVVNFIIALQGIFPSSGS